MEWAYDALYIGTALDEEKRQQLADLGSQGWSLCAGGPEYIYFRRPLVPNQAYSIVHQVNQIGTTNTPIVPANTPAAILGLGVLLSGTAPQRAVTTIALVTADLTKTYWSCKIDLTSAKQDVLIPIQERASGAAIGVDISGGITAQTVAESAAPDWTVTFNVNVGAIAA